MINTDKYVKSVIIGEIRGDKKGRANSSRPIGYRLSLPINSTNHRTKRDLNPRDEEELHRGS